MNQYWAKSFILHLAAMLLLALGSLQMCARKDDTPEEETIVVDLMQIGEKTNVKPAPKQEEEKPKPAKKPEPETKKEPEPKPEPKPQKQPEPKPEPKPQPKKSEKEPPKETEKTKESEKEPDPKELDELLKTLEYSKPTPKVKSNQTENTDTKSKSTSNFDPNAPLTVSEVDYIKTLIMRQIVPCWNVPAGARDAGSLKIKLDIDVERDGGIKFIGFADEVLYNSDPYYQVAADSARRAVLDPRCNPLRQLPPMEKFNKWHELTLTFDPSKLIY